MLSLLPHQSPIHHLAVVHRNSSNIGSQIRVLLFADRIESLRPGRLPDTVTIEKLSVGTSFARNPLLVRLMGNLGYMDRLGRGSVHGLPETGRFDKAVSFEQGGEMFRVVHQMSL